MENIKVLSEQVGEIQYRMGFGHLIDKEKLRSLVDDIKLELKRNADSYGCIHDEIEFNLKVLDLITRNLANENSIQKYIEPIQLLNQVLLMMLDHRGITQSDFFSYIGKSDSTYRKLVNSVGKLSKTSALTITSGFMLNPYIYPVLINSLGHKVKQTYDEFEINEELKSKITKEESFSYKDYLRNSNRILKRKYFRV